MMNREAFVRAQDEHLDIMIALAFDLDDAEAVQQMSETDDPPLTTDDESRADVLLSSAFTKAGQQEVVKNPFSTSSSPSLYATISAPIAASRTSSKPSSFIPVITCPKDAYVNWLAMEGATMATTFSLSVFFSALLIASITSTILDTSTVAPKGQ